MLKINNLTKSYSMGKGVFFLNVDIKAGEITGVLGSNGCGKTTLLKLILNLVPFSEGQILYNNRPVDTQYNDIAFISEEGTFLPQMLTLAYGKFLARYYTHFDIIKYKNLLNRFEISEHTRISELSKGQQMRVEIAAGFAMNAKLIILDEPFTGLDVYAKDDVIKLLIGELKEDVTIIITTHNVDEIEQVVDRCLLMDKGKIVEDIMLEDLYDKGMDIKKLMDQYRSNR